MPILKNNNKKIKGCKKNSTKGMEEKK